MSNEHDGKAEEPPAELINELEAAMAEVDEDDFRPELRCEIMMDCNGKLRLVWHEPCTLEDVRDLGIQIAHTASRATVLGPDFDPGFELILP